MEFELLLVRHGETEANRDGILQGHVDYPLTELGVTQAKTLAKTVSPQTWDKVWASDLPRCVTTAGLILSLGPQHDIKQTKNIREFCFGVRDGLPRGCTMKEAREAYAKKNNVEEQDIVDFNESNAQMKSRQIEFIEEVRKDLCEGVDSADLGTQKRVLCVSHGGTIRAFIKNFVPGVEGVDKIGNCATSTFLIKFDKQHNKKGFNVTAKVEELNVTYS